MPYRPSPPMQDWSTVRAMAVDVLVRAGVAAGNPPPLTDAIVVRLLAEFQGFARDLHDRTARTVVVAAGCRPQHVELLVSASTRERALDRKNPTMDVLRSDFERLGVDDLVSGLRARNPHHEDDARRTSEVVRARNRVAHGHTSPWVSLPDARTAVERPVRALDEAMWDDLEARFPGHDPWSP